MYYITNQKGSYLFGFYPNGGFEIKDVFHFSRINKLTFDSKKDAETYLDYVRSSCVEQKERWGEWLDVALKVVDNLKVSN